MNSCLVPYFLRKWLLWYCLHAYLKNSISNDSLPKNYIDLLRSFLYFQRGNLFFWNNVIVFRMNTGLTWTAPFLWLLSFCNLNAIAIIEVLFTSIINHNLNFLPLTSKMPMMPLLIAQSSYFFCNNYKEHSNLWMVVSWKEKLHLKRKRYKKKGLLGLLKAWINFFLDVFKQNLDFFLFLFSFFFFTICINFKASILNKIKKYSLWEIRERFLCFFFKRWYQQTCSAYLLKTKPYCLF